MPCWRSQGSTAIRIRRECGDTPAVAPLGFRPQLIGVGKQPAGVEGHHVEIASPALKIACVIAWSSMPKLVVNTMRSADLAPGGDEALEEIKLFILSGQSRYQRCPIEIISILL